MRKIRITALLIAIVLALSATAILAACGDTTGPEPGDVTTAEPATTPVTENPYDKDGYLKDKIPEELDYAEQTVNIFACNEQKSKTWSETDDGDMLNSSLYYRLQSTEERLGIKLNFIWENGNWNNRVAFMDKVKVAVENGQGEYDLVMAYNLNPPVMAVNGLLCDLSDNKYLDLTAPWWSARLLASSTVNGHNYFVVDNSSAGSIRNMTCVMFDKTLISDYNLTSDALYDIAINHEWTLDKLEELIKDVYKELNGDGKVSYGDLFGFANVDKPRIDAFFYGSGLTISGENEAGNIVMKLGDEKAQTVLERLNAFFHENPCVYFNDEKMYTMFKNHQALFYETPIAIVDQKLDFDFGVLPVPMLNAEQEEYVTYIANTHDSWCIPGGAKNEEMSGAVIECLASEAYRKVAPAYFETMLKYKYSSDDRAAQVYDIVRDTVIFDFGYMFGNSFSQNPILLYRNAVIDGAKNWTSIYKTFSAMYDRELGAMIDKLANPK